jgi:hypothetical protein
LNSFFQAAVMLATLSASVPFRTFAATQDGPVAAAVDPSTSAEVPDAPQAAGATPASGSPQTHSAVPSGPPAPPDMQQPKRILGVMPNYRAVSTGAVYTPPTWRESLVMATENSFDYSSFIFTGLTSMIAEGDDAHPQLGKGVPGFWAYSWRGFIDKTDGNYLVLFALPTVFRQDERYYTMGKGTIWHRTVYSLGSVLITPNYQGNRSFNYSELAGRGIAQAVSVVYYPAQERNFEDVASKYGYAVMRDALANGFREFWPDISAHLFHKNNP